MIHEFSKVAQFHYITALFGNLLRNSRGPHFLPTEIPWCEGANPPSRRYHHTSDTMGSWRAGSSANSGQFLMTPPVFGLHLSTLFEAPLTHIKHLNDGRFFSILFTAQNICPLICIEIFRPRRLQSQELIMDLATNKIACT